MAKQTTTRRELTGEETDVLIVWLLNKAAKELGIEVGDGEELPALEVWQRAYVYIDRAVKLLPRDKRKPAGRMPRKTSSSDSS
jgi:hypothetical protein